ncbi:MAG: CARDB domain-containing protein, partial [Rhodothermia bacterium]
PGETRSQKWRDVVFYSPTPEYDSTTAIALGAFSHVGSLSNDQSYTETQDVRIPDGISGPAYFFVETDEDRRVFEHTFEQNNRGATPHTVQVTLAPYPDLQVIRVQGSPMSLVAGQQIALTYEIENNGTAEIAQAWVDSVFVSSQPEWDPDQAQPMAAVLRSGTIGVGESLEHTVAVTVPTNVDGTFYIFVKADASDSAFEYPDTDGNIARSSAATADPYPPIDLSAAFDDVPSAGNSGDEIVVNLRISNVGQGKTLANTWIDAIYLSDDEKLDPGHDILVVNSRHEGALGAGASYSYSQNIRLPDGEAGSLFLIFQTDTLGRNSESNTRNNLVTSPIEVTLTPPADLLVTSIDVPDTVHSAQLLTLSWTVENVGEGPTPGDNWFDEVHLSNDRLLDREDLLLGTFEHEGALNASSSRIGSLQTMIPAYAAGPYYLIIGTDVRREIYEHLAEGNNLGSKIVELTLAQPSDLTVTSVTAPPEAAPGQPVSISWTIRNDGPNPARGLMREAVFVSPDTSWSQDDPLLGVVEREIDLAAGESAEIAMKVDFARTFNADGSGNITEELPGVLPGDYYAIVRSDVANSIRETNDQNNAARSPGSIKTDIPLLELDVPQTFAVGEGQSRFFRLNVEAETDLRLSLESDRSLAGNELYVAFDRAPAAAGDFDFSAAELLTANQELIVPSAQAGTHYLLALARSISGDSTQSITLNAGALAFSIASISPSVGGQGQVTTEIQGAGFRESTSIFLEDIQGNRIDGEIIDFVNTTELRVRWHLTDSVLGSYDVKAGNDGTLTSLPGGFEVQEATELTTKNVITAPEASRAGGRTELVFEYTNAANVDIPYLEIEIKTQNTPHLQLFASSGLLKPGEIFSSSPGDAGPDFLIADGIYISSLIARDVAPGTTLKARIVVDPSPAGPMGYSSDALALSEEGYLIILIAEFENARTYVLDNPQDFDAEAVMLAGNPDAFMNRHLQAYVDAGLLDELPSSSAVTEVLSPPDYSAVGKNMSVANGLGPSDVQIADLILSPGDLFPPLDSGCGTACPNLTNNAYCQCKSKVPGPCYKLNRSADRIIDNYCDYRARKCRVTELQGKVKRFGPGGGIAGGFFGGNPPDCGCTNIKEACDPNDIVGPDGYGTEGWISPEQTLPYTIRFENDPLQASAPAQVVNVRHPLDPSVDARTFRLGSFGFANITVDVPDNVSFHRERLDVTDSLGVFVDVTAGIDVVKNEAFWSLTTIDPETGDQPINDPFVGFLPINDSTGVGEGFVSYTVRSSGDAQTGDRIDAQAEIVFDINAPIETPPIFNTLDATAPVSTVNVLSGRQDTTAFFLTWLGSDDGSGVADYALYASVDGGEFEPIVSQVTDTSYLFIGEIGRRYQFFTLARDNAGNNEPMKSSAEAVTVVSTEGDEPAGIPKEFALYQNFPNPFNPSTTIPFDLPENGNVEIVVYDIMGRQVLVIDKGELQPGKYQHLLNMSNYA